MKYFILLLAFSASLLSQAQVHVIGLKGGKNYTNINQKDFIVSSGFRTGITAGLSYEYRFKKGFLLGTDIIYNQRGFTRDFIGTTIDGKEFTETSKVLFNYDYVSMPLKVGFSSGKKFYTYTAVAAIPSVLVSAKHISPLFDQNGKTIGEFTFSTTELISKYDFAGSVEIGAGYKFKNRFDISASIALQRSSTSITSKNYFPFSIIKHYGMGFSLGLKYVLTKKKPE